MFERSGGEREIERERTDHRSKGEEQEQGQVPEQLWKEATKRKQEPPP